MPRNGSCKISINIGWEIKLGKPRPNPNNQDIVTNDSGVLKSVQKFCLNVLQEADDAKIEELRYDII